MEEEENIIEFKQNETKAALFLINKFRKKAEKLKRTVEGAAESSAQKDATYGLAYTFIADEIQEWVISCWYMETEILKQAIEDLERNIETQSFNV